MKKNIKEDPAVKCILKVIESNTGYTLDDLKASTKKEGIIENRQLAMFMISTHCKFSSTKIATLFNKKTHGSVLHAVKVINNYLDTDKKFVEMFNKINNEIILCSPQYDNIEGMEILLNLLVDKYISFHCHKNNVELLDKKGSLVMTKNEHGTTNIHKITNIINEINTNK